MIFDYCESIDGPQSRLEAGGRRVLCKGGGGGDGGAAAREAERQARISAATESVNRLFGIGDDSAKAQRESIYSTTRDDTRNYYAKQLEEDKSSAARELNFAKARAGTVGSSQGIDLNTEFQRRYDRGILDVANRADSAASGMRSSDEQARLGLISKIVAGMDQGSAISSAIGQLQTNAETSRQNAMAGRMANVFSDLFGAYNASQQAAGANAAKQQWDNQFGNVYPNNSTYGGTVSKA